MAAKLLPVLKLATKVTIAGGALYVTYDSGLLGGSAQGSEVLGKAKAAIPPAVDEWVKYFGFEPSQKWDSPLSRRGTRVRNGWQLSHKGLFQTYKSKIEQFQEFLLFHSRGAVIHICSLIGPYSIRWLYQPRLAVPERPHQMKSDILQLADILRT
uniref:MICOS complex subunit MIC13 n=1 Tax=Oncorhynchus tshawytscha TaxID=74940 RepID=A0A8C8BPG2_ONCTS